MYSLIGGGLPKSQKGFRSVKFIHICEHPEKNQPSVSKWQFSLFSGILFSEASKSSRNPKLQIKIVVNLGMSG